MSVVITNKMKRVWFVPPGAGDAVNASIAVNPGESVSIDSARWDSVRKGNKVIDALLAGRFITAGHKATEADELVNPAAPQAPEELRAPVVDPKGNDMTPTTSLDVKEISLGDEPVEVVRRGRGRPASA